MSEEAQETEATTELPPQEERDFVVAEDLETTIDECKLLYNNFD